MKQRANGPSRIWIVRIEPGRGSCAGPFGGPGASPSIPARVLAWNAVYRRFVVELADATIYRSIRAAETAITRFRLTNCHVETAITRFRLTR